MIDGTTHPRLFMLSLTVGTIFAAFYWNHGVTRKMAHSALKGVARRFAPKLG
jgi:hypothetical protein